MEIGFFSIYNNLLGVLTGNISLLELDFPENLDTIQDCKYALEELKKITSQLLTFSKGNILHKEISNINEIIRETSDFITHGKNILISYDFTNNLKKTNIDPTQIGRVIQNILLNAVQALPNGGRKKLEKYWKMMVDKV